MSRYADLQTQPAQPTIEGDSQFSGLDMKNDRDKLQPGQYARGENKRCYRGVVEDRPGVVTPVFANVEPMTILGSGVYSNPNGEEVQLHATPQEVRLIKSGSYPATIAIPDGFSLQGRINFSQQFNVVLLHQEDGGPTLVWDGIAPTFTRLTKLDPADTSTVVVPDPPWSVNFGYRAWFPTGSDTLGASDELDYTSYDKVLHNFRINTGEATSIVGVHPFSRGRLIVGNTRTIDVLENVIGDLTLAAMDEVSDEHNLASRRAQAMVGGDLFFLSSKPQGVFQIGEATQDHQLSVAPIPISDPIEPLMKTRVNWRFADLATMAIQGVYLFLFVPIDDSEVLNAAFVYNISNKQWVGVDSWNLDALFQIDDAYVADYYGSKGLYVTNHEAGLIHVLEQGIDDELGLSFTVGGDPVHTSFPMRSVFESRGYATLGWNATTRRDFKRVEMITKTLRPSITVTELGDKADDERPLQSTPITKSPTKYQTFGRDDWNPTNVNNDFDTPGREDYSVDWSSEFSLPEQGINIEQRQHTPIKFSTKARAQYLSYRMENNQGRADAAGILIESVGVSREPRRGG